MVCIGVVRVGSDSAQASFGLIDGALFIALLWFAEAPNLAALTLSLLVVWAQATAPSASPPVALALSMAIVTMTAGAIVSVSSLAACAYAITTVFAAPSIQHDVNGVVLIFVTLAGSLIGVTVRLRLGHADRRTREAEERAAHAAAAERLRLIDELHDVVAHDLTLALSLARVAKEDPTLSSDGLFAVAGIERSTQRALADVRRLLGLLGHDRVPKETLSTSDLSSLLRSLGSDLRASGRPTEVVIDIDADLISALASEHIMHAAQEAVTNTIKHAASDARVQISLRSDGNGYVVEVTNTISDLAEPTPGERGLARLRDRLETVGGSLVVTHDATHWSVSAQIPERSVSAIKTSHQI